MTSGNKKFGLRIKELREAKGITQEKLAEEVGVEYQTINRIENGVYFTNYSNLEKISKVFQVQIAELFNYSHIKKSTALIKEINGFLETASAKDLAFVHKIIQALFQYKK